MPTQPIRPLEGGTSKSQRGRFTSARIGRRFVAVVVCTGLVGLAIFCFSLRAETPATPSANTPSTQPAQGFAIKWVNPPKVADPLRLHKTYDSASMGIPVGYQIYLPPGYGDAGNDKRYPVIYWLHGLGGSESGDGFPSAMVDRAIREKKVPPLIMVYGNGGSSCWYADSPDGKRMSQTTVIKELIPHIDATYRTISTRDARAIQGMSMGGSGAMKFALMYPELFSSVVSFAGSYRNVDELSKEPTRSYIFQSAFGGDAARMMAQHPETILAKNADALRGKVAIKFFIGTADKPVLLAGNHRLKAQLEELKIPHEYREIPGIDHNLVKLAAAVQTEALEFAVKHFKLNTVGQ